MGNCYHHEIVASQDGKQSKGLVRTINSLRTVPNNDNDLDSSPRFIPKLIIRKNFQLVANTQVIPTTGIHSALEFDSSYAFIPDIMSLPSEFIRGIWNKHHRPLPEYEEAANLIILEPQWKSQTILLRNLESIRKEFQSDPTLERRILGNFEQILLDTIRKAYPENSNSRSQEDLIFKRNIFNTIMSLFNGLQWRQPYFAYSLAMFSENETKDNIGNYSRCLLLHANQFIYHLDAANSVAKLSEVCDRASRCFSAQRQAFNVVIIAAQRYKGGSKAENIDLTTKEGAFTRYHHPNTDSQTFIHAP